MPSPALRCQRSGHHELLLADEPGAAMEGTLHHYYTVTYSLRSSDETT
jgi:hypothetical protein